MLLRNGQLMSRLVLPWWRAPASPPLVSAPACHPPRRWLRSVPRSGRSRRPLPGAVRTAPGRHRRSTPLIQLLARLGWQRDPATWTVPCRDLDGHRTHLLIRLSPSGITITTGATGPLRLDAWQVEQLRAAARDAIHTFGLARSRLSGAVDARVTEADRRRGQVVPG